MHWLGVGQNSVAYSGWVIVQIWMKPNDAYDLWISSELDLVSLNPSNCIFLYFSLASGIKKSVCQGLGDGWTFAQVLSQPFSNRNRDKLMGLFWFQSPLL
jgi:hypothetical protein